MTFRDRLKNYFKAGFPCVALQTTEEARAIADVIAVAKELEKGITTWSATEGLRQVLPTPKEIDDTEDLVPACKGAREEGMIYIFRDIQVWPFDRDPILVRAFRDALSRAPSAGSCIVCIGPEIKPHGTFEKLITVLDYALPSIDDLKAIAKGIAESTGGIAQKGSKEKKYPEASDEVIRAMGGLSTSEAENALALSFVETKSFDPKIIYREKVQAVKRSGLLEIVEPDPRGLEAIGGLDELKSWIIKRRRAYTPEAEKFGLPNPKGIMLVGVPGTGKSLSAKAIGTALGVPTVRLDIGNLFQSLVGESEARTRDALKLAEAMSPCVLWVDEIDKGFAGAASSGSGDSGVGKRVFGTVISWMQERRRPVFLVATANQVQGLPPELLRKGRFDEIFAIDLPNSEERRIITEIQIRAKGREPGKFDLQAVATATDGFTGSEIENSVNEALFNAFDAGTELSTELIVQAARATTPLAVTAKEQIDLIRQWAKARARFASKPETATTPASRRVMK